MSQFAPGQPDLFAPPPPPPAAPEPPALEQLAALLAILKPATRMPWPDLKTATQAEYRVIALGSQSGEEGKKLATAISGEMERLFYTAEQAGLDPFPVQPRSLTFFLRKPTSRAMKT